ncbi:MAG: hypothetical protein BGO67_02220 [Alphaproteobacteria bacterium 41-28]|nr:MAG: hypothetical protein BGO67_02220 [Alphaproteobacteria bacterium 41-28]
MYRQLANIPVDQNIPLSLEWLTTESLPIPQQRQTELLQSERTQQTATLDLPLHQAQADAARQQEEADTIQTDNREEDGKLKESLKGKEKKEEPRAISTASRETLQQRLRGAISKMKKARIKKGRK